jgi:hypothetical protein
MKLLSGLLISASLLAGCVTTSDDDLDLASVDDGLEILQEAQPSIAADDVIEAAPSCDITVTPRTQLMITNLSVVNDPVRTRWSGKLTNPADGAWHFGRLMTEMAGDNDPATFVRSWLAQWQTAVTVNGQTVPPRAKINDIIKAWPKTSAGKLDLTKAPFRLLAIANRFDLRSPGNAGEGRLVFGVIDPSNPIVDTKQFTVILEYKMLAATADVKTWANLWKDLSTAPLGSDAYRAKLQAITGRFTKRNAAPGRTNGSAISQVRTNEIALASPWELREFRLTTTGQLRMVAPALTPADSTPNFNNTAKLATFMTQNAVAIKAQTHAVPLRFQDAPFAAGRVTNGIDFWNAPGITDNPLRHRFSLNTCNGCHGSETSTFFLHVSPRAADAEAVLSTFLTGEFRGAPFSFPDPVVTKVTRTFNDLQRRARGLRTFLCANQ